MEKHGTKSETNTSVASKNKVQLTTEVIMQATGQSRSTASMVLKALELSNRAKRAATRGHFVESGGTVHRLGGKPLNVWETDKSVLASLFGDKTDAVIKVADESRDTYARLSQVPSQATPEVTSIVGDAPYGRKADGTPRAKPGRKTGLSHKETTGDLLRTLIGKIDRLLDK